ncbi:MAG: hypothetical protein ABH842_04455 [Candidatus Micrarchaeota archaeon]
MKLKAIKFYGVDAQHLKEDRFTNLAVNLSMQEGKPVGSDFRSDFIFTVMYDPNIATMKFSGYVLIEGTKTEINELTTIWKKQKVLPKEITEHLINTITFQGQTNGVLVAKALSLTPPLLSPKIQVQVKPSSAQSKPSKKK